MPGARVLLVEGDAGVAASIRSCLEAAGHLVVTVFTSVEEALARAGELRPDLVIADVAASDRAEGGAAAGRVGERCGAPVILLIGRTDPKSLRRAGATGPATFLIKPFSEPELLAAVEAILVRRETERRLLESERLHRLLFDSANDAVFVHPMEADGRPGRFVAVNDVACARLGHSREELLAMSPLDIDAASAAPGREAALARLKAGGRTTFVMEHRTRDGRCVPVEISSRVFEHDGRTMVLSIARDVTERRRAERRSRLVLGILDLLNRKGSRPEAIRSILMELKAHMGVEAVGIRLREGEDFPYYEVAGFPEEFVRSERSLCAYDPDGRVEREDGGLAVLECMCGCVLRGRTDPALPYFTEGGSFWTNRSSELVAAIPEDRRPPHLRGLCAREGYESFALIPLSSGGEVIGLLQLNDRRRDVFDLETVEFLEGIGASIGVAVARRQAQEELDRKRDRLSEAQESALRESEAKYRAVLASMADAVFTVSGLGAVLDANQRALELLGCRREELVGRPLDAFLASGDGGSGGGFRRLRAALQSGAVRDYDTHLRPPAGPAVPVSLSCAFLHVSEGRSDMVVVARDISVRRRLEDEQREYAQRLEGEAQRAHDYAELVLKSAGSRVKLVGRSKPIQDVVDFIKGAAEVVSPVLVLGESGTGKEVVARSIHLNGPRAEKPFVVVDCSALSGALLESEIFGHEKGAFTGAVEAKPGLVEVAEGGTLFVDEVGEMPLELQATLLRVLERGEFRRVGSVQNRTADIRVVAATNRDLTAEVKRRRFRADLFFRLNVLAITVPPLRERREDVESLARHFLENCRVTVAKPKKLGRDALRHLEAYDWPGNVRELANVVERAIILSGSGDTIKASHLPIEVLKAGGKAAAGSDGRPASRKLEDVEREAIESAMAAAGGNKSRAAEMLGISRLTLRRKLESFEKTHVHKRRRGGGLVHM